MLKRTLILSFVLGVGVVLTPVASSANVTQPGLQAQTIVVDDSAIDSANSNDSDNAVQSDSDSDAISNDDDSDDSLSSDATE